MTHLDSHHHIHCHPLVLWAIHKLNSNFSLPQLKVRSIRNYEYTGSLNEYGWTKKIYKSLINLIQKGFFLTTDYFSSIVKYSDKSIVTIEDILCRLSDKSKSIEIMCHPGRSEEYSSLMEMKSLDDIALKLDIDFINYSMLINK